MPLQNGACTQPDPEDIRTELARICASVEFQKAQKLSAFLSLVVDLKLKGEEKIIKAYTVGTLALGRKKDFDPSNNAIVRVMATRLRDALSHYYAGSGIEDPIVISIPKGTYVPVFRVREPAIIGDGESEAVASDPVSMRGPQEMASSETVLQLVYDLRPASTVLRPPCVRDARSLPPSANGLPLPAVPLHDAQDRPAAVGLLSPPVAPTPEEPEENPSDPTPSGPEDDTPKKPGRRIGLRAIAITVAVFFAKVSLALAVISVSTGLDGSGSARTSLSDAFSTPLVVAVLEIADPASRPDPEATGSEFRDTLIRALSHFEDVTVLAPTANPASARFHIEGRISSGPKPHLSLRLVRWPTGEVVWTYAGSVADPEARNSAVRIIATAIGSPGGLASKRVARWRLSGGTPWEECRLAADEYFRHTDSVHHAKASSCLHTSIADSGPVVDQPGRAHTLSLLGRMHIEAHRHGFGRGDALVLALSAGQAAAKLAPDSAWAWQTICDAKFHGGDFEGAAPACENARRKNPFDADIQAFSGARLIAQGDHRRGIAEVEEALRDNPSEPAWYKLWLFLGFWRAGETERAQFWLHNLPDDLDPFGQIVLAIAAIERGRTDDAGNAIRRLKALQPEFAAVPGEMVERYFPEPAFAAAVLSALTRAGLNTT